MGASANNVLYFAPHKMDGGGEIDMRFRIHLGSTTNLEVIGDGVKARDAWSYAKTVSTRDAAWDGKMQDAFGSTQWGQVSASFRDSLFAYCKTYNVP